ncbi:hypothetical protein K3553_04690 [Leisingera aquaemixtae]|uniref:hypothetical protein n=1 Tax=Leisingera aquaemixtae TaxID=1396826 RepID=UPI0021A3EF25|nr:hypothetical protein [Leisingera aquaemixtae]UWQ25763.1 hypothetical protein K3553_04690 [Leisingera aquaemixtae]
MSHINQMNGGWDLKLDRGSDLGRFSNEKRSYWERRLHDLLRPVPAEDLVVMSWAIEAMRDGFEEAARRRLQMPGSPADHQIGGNFFVPPWSIDAILREKLSLGPSEKDAKRLNLRSWNGVAKLLNVYTSLSNVESVMDYAPSDVLAAMPRLFWPQYDWQLGTSNMSRVGRAWHVYATDQGKAAFSAKHGIDLEVFLKIAFGIYAGSSENPAIRAGFLSPLGITNTQLHQVRQIIGNTLEGHYEWARNTGSPYIPRDFLRSVTKERPIFELSDSKGRAYCVPSRSNLMLRITDGLYYDIVSDPDARRRSGEAFECLCLKAVQHYFGASRSVEPERKTSYGMSADILVEDNTDSTGLIIECKIRRIPQKVLTSPDPFEDCADAFDDIVKGIVQIWRTYHELYSASPMNMAGVVLQYDPWTILGSAFVSKLFHSAHEKANALEIPTSDRIPVAMVGYFDFENLLKQYEYCDIFEAVCDWSSEKFHGPEFGGVLSIKKQSKVTKSTLDYKNLVTAAVPWWGESPV